MTLTPADWDTLRALLQAVQAGRPIYYAINDAPKYIGNVSFMPETATQPWVIVCDPALVSAWKQRIPQIRQAYIMDDGKIVTREGKL